MNTKGQARTVRRRAGRVATNAVSIVLTVALSMFGIDPAFAYNTDYLIPQADNNSYANVVTNAISTELAAIQQEVANAKAEKTESTSTDISNENATVETDSDASAADNDEIGIETENATTEPATEPDTNDADTTDEADAEYAAGTLETAIVTADGHTFKVIINYDADAEIPEGAELVVKEVNQMPSDPDWEDDPAYEGRPLETETFITAKTMKKRLEVMADALGLKADEDEAIYYSKLLNVAIKANGETIKPQAVVEVIIETDEIAKPREVDADDADAAATAAEAADAKAAGVAIVDESEAQTLELVRFATNKKKAT